MKTLLTALLILSASTCFAQVDTVKMETKRYFTNGDWIDLVGVFEVSFDDDICTIKQSGKMIYQDIYAYNGARLWTRYDVFVVDIDTNGDYYILSNKEKKSVKLKKIK